MPVFDFECLNCGETFSELVKGSEEIECPKCKSTKLKKLISGFYTISDNTRFETNAKDLPSMAAWQKSKKTVEKPKPKLKTKTASAGKIKPRAAVHHRKAK